MNIDFSPKRQFQANDEIVKELRALVTRDNFHHALSAALAEYVYRRTPSAEQLIAVKSFIDTFLHLALPEEPLPAFPVRQLDHTVYERTTTPTRTT